MSNYALCQSQTGSKVSDELFVASRQPTADASRHRRSSSRILLCSAAGAGVFESCGLRPALGHTLNDDRHDAEPFSTPFRVRQPDVCRGHVWGTNAEPSGEAGSPTALLSDVRPVENLRTFRDILFLAEKTRRPKRNRNWLRSARTQEEPATFLHQDKIV